jgi:tryptophan halogenase
LNYAYHLDAGRFAALLRRMSEANGAKRIEGKIRQVNLAGETGDIKSLVLEDGREIEGDFFIDCTGFRSLLMGQALHVSYDDWSHFLPCDSAIAIQTESCGPLVPYTRAIAHDAGWRWRIPLQHRVGNGLVYCGRYLDQDSAVERLMSSIEGAPTIDPRFIRFQTGARREQWKKNCIVLGLASGFMEPLESTSIHLIQKSIMRFMRLLPQNRLVQADIKEFNDQTFDDMLSIRDFLILHYVTTERRDSPFWRYCAGMKIPDTLRQKIELFAECGRVFRKNDELFAENSWVQVMLGQGISPRSYHPIADKMTDEELNYFLGHIKKDIANAASKLPAHEDYVRQYCARGTPPPTLRRSIERPPICPTADQSR